MSLLIADPVVPFGLSIERLLADVSCAGHPTLDQFATYGVFRKPTLQRNTGSPESHRWSRCSVRVFRLLFR